MRVVCYSVIRISVCRFLLLWWCFAWWGMSCRFFGIVSSPCVLFSGSFLWPGLCWSIALLEHGLMKGRRWFEWCVRMGYWLEICRGWMGCIWAVCTSMWVSVGFDIALARRVFWWQLRFCFCLDCSIFEVKVSAGEVCVAAVFVYQLIEFCGGYLVLWWYVDGGDDDVGVLWRLLVL